MYRDYVTRIPLNLRFFGEDAAGDRSSAGGTATDAASMEGSVTGGDGGAGGAAEQDATAQTTNSPEQQAEPLTAESVQKLISAALADAAQRQTEAEKYAKMNKEEKAAHDSKKQEDEINSRLAEVTRRELRIEAHKTLTEKGLPSELLDVLQYSDAESCTASIAAVEKAFRAAVETGVNDRLRGKPPGASASPATLTVDAIKNMSPEEIAANYAEVEKALAGAGR